MIHTLSSDRISLISEYNNFLCFCWVPHKMFMKSSLVWNFISNSIVHCNNDEEMWSLNCHPTFLPGGESFLVTCSSTSGRCWPHNVPISFPGSWKNKLSTLTPEKCQKKCNERFGYILQEPPKAESSSVGIPPGNPNLPPNAPQKSPQNVPPEVSQKPSRIPFTTAKVSDDKSECKCYFNRGQILPYLKTRITNYSSWESVFFYYLTGKPFGYDDGVTHLKKEQIKVVNENGSEKIVHNRFDKSEKNPPETKPTKPN